MRSGSTCFSECTTISSPLQESRAHSPWSASPSSQPGLCRGLHSRMTGSARPLWSAAVSTATSSARAMPVFLGAFILISAPASLSHLPKTNTFTLEQHKLVTSQKYLLGSVSGAEHFHSSANTHFLKLHNYPNDFREYFSLSAKNVPQVPVTCRAARQPGVCAGRRGAGGIGAVRDPRFRAGAGTGLRWGSCTSAEISTYSWLRLYFQPPCCALLQGSPSGTLTHQNPLSTPKAQAPYVCYIVTRFQTPRPTTKPLPTCRAASPLCVSAH